MNCELLQEKIAELKQLFLESGIETSGELDIIESKVMAISKAELVWKQVELARHPDRPYSIDYIEKIFDNFIELHGDRIFGDDAAIIGGLAFLGGIPVTVIAHQKGRTFKERATRRHGMANPEGYRKALRLAKQAEKFQRPIITFVDTFSASPSIGAEERGIGEGGSGGALGICVGDKVYMLENAIYSVVSPEAFASILLRNKSRVKDAAAMLKITSTDLMAFNVINGIIAEPPGSAKTNLDAIASTIKEILIKDITELQGKNPSELVRCRNENIRKIGLWNEGT